MRRGLLALTALGLLASCGPPSDGTYNVSVVNDMGQSVTIRIACATEVGTDGGAERCAERALAPGASTSLAAGASGVGPYVVLGQDKTILGCLRAHPSPGATIKLSSAVTGC